MDQITLHGGVVRRLSPDDLPAFREHLLRLDKKSRYDRFAMAASDDFLIRYAERCMTIDDVIYGFWVDGALLGAGELRGAGCGAFDKSVEGAFSVEAQWRRRSVGTTLLQLIIAEARRRKAEKLFMTCLASNVAMQGLAQKFAAELRFETDDATGRLIVGAPSNPASSNPWVQRQIIDDATNFATAIVDLQPRAFSAANVTA